MTTTACCVCEASDKRSLVEVTLLGGARATLCGSHALMHRRSTVQARSIQQLRALLRNKRAGSERREGREDKRDALGAALSAAFGRERRTLDRRGA
jgi:hypothetical protein